MVVQEHQSGTILAVRVVPRAAMSEIDAVVNGSLRIRLAAPPVDGAANRALITFLAKLCDLPKSRVSILAGEKAKQKRVLLHGLDLATVRAKLNLDTP